MGNTGSMTPTEALRPTLIILAWLMALSWLHRSVTALRGMESVLDLTEIEKDSLPALPEIGGPDVTVVVPARMSKIQLRRPSNPSSAPKRFERRSLP